MGGDRHDAVYGWVQPWAYRLAGASHGLSEFFSVPWPEGCECDGDRLQLRRGKVSDTVYSLVTPAQSYHTSGRHAHSPTNAAISWHAWSDPDPHRHHPVSKLISLFLSITFFCLFISLDKKNKYMRINRTCFLEQTEQLIISPISVEFSPLARCSVVVHALILRNLVPTKVFARG